VKIAEPVNLKRLYLIYKYEPGSGY